MQIFFTFIPTCFYCFCPHCLTIKLDISYFENGLLINILPSYLFVFLTLLETPVFLQHSQLQLLIKRKTSSSSVLFVVSPKFLYELLFINCTWLKAFYTNVAPYHSCNYSDTMFNQKIPLGSVQEASDKPYSPISELLHASVSKRVLVHNLSTGNDELRILMQIKLNYLTIVEHQDSLRNRHKQQLGNGPVRTFAFRSRPVPFFHSNAGDPKPQRRRRERAGTSPEKK